ncbi:MAG: GGDEF domain-containing protein, partial [Rhodoferax sp.]|nr:GGDEF domain-containing protein [Rhodoferax sp.]
GHQVGDELLNVVAQRLQDCVRRMDTVGRIGGDEFVVLLPLVSSVNDAVVVAEKICQSLHEAVNIAGHHVMISASVGVALYPDHAHDMKTLIHFADTAMYLAKKAGGSQMKVAVVANPDRAV